METITVNIAEHEDFYSRQKDELLFPPSSSCPDLPTTPINLPLNALKDNGMAQSSPFS
jgi:hypothetical protein